MVCSNSLRAEGLKNAVGLLKEEMRLLDSLVMEIADKTRVPAAGALAVDREAFSKAVTEKITNHPNITIVQKEVKNSLDFPDPTIVATGPLTSDALAEKIQETLGRDSLYFFDAAAPDSHGGKRRYDKSVFRFPLREGNAGLRELPDDKRGVRYFLRRSDFRRDNFRFTDLKTIRFSRAVCRSKLWQKEGKKPFCSGR